ncbi:uncharacterized protein LOC101234683 isoform X1 [Hydra vulgaris]|uniref:uncharacterized protein LOC101234683 isoform X1 n=1 Tax=Hydra vulgaris TaxID=6087 RepID=UPI0006416C81|nr:uncharacterized protein LOC101234683 [Hydra vulgaris]XP_047133310.1 uncharacterized protein LOC101234683 [Hydra vulgaris]
MILSYLANFFLLLTSFLKVNCNYVSPLVNTVAQNKSLAITQTPYYEENTQGYAQQQTNYNGGLISYEGNWVPSNQITFPNAIQALAPPNNYLYFPAFSANLNIHNRVNRFSADNYQLTKNPKWYPPKPYYFNDKLCQERKHRMDWLSMLEPCKSKMDFGMHIYSYLKTEVNYSYISDLHLRNTGDYSSFRIKTYDTTRKPKTIGGDTWRVFIRGPVYIEPYVYDLNNGEYEVLFFTLDAGMYQIEVILEGSLCSSYVNPPYDWFKKGDFNGHFQNEYMFKEYKHFPFLLTYRTWNALSNFSVYVHEGSKSRITKNLIKMQNWQLLCNVKCNFLTDGFGRWKNKTWLPYVQSKTHTSIQSSNKLGTYVNRLSTRHKLRRKQGLLWIYGDCYAYNFYQSVWNTSLCTQQFKECNRTYNWIYPRWNPDNKKDKSIHLKHDYFINLPWLVKYFAKLLNKDKLKRSDSGMLLNVGLHYIRSTSFDIYKQLIDGYIKAIKSHPTDVVWRTTTAIYRAEKYTHKRFQTNQRALLFNAYSMSAMCRAGIAVVDVFPLTSAIEVKPTDGIHYDVTVFTSLTKILQEYYKYI